VVSQIREIFGKGAEFFGTRRLPPGCQFFAAFDCDLKHGPDAFSVAETLPSLQSVAYGGSHPFTSAERFIADSFCLH
jgi:hypothetical protein